MPRLTYTQIKPTREQLAQQQGYRCALCNDLIVDDAVLDHCHTSGLVRAVLHRGCNALLGKLENNLKRNKMTPDRFKSWCENLIEYINTEHTDLVHPKHKPPKVKKPTKPRK
jgi:hypothetical protein